VAYYPGTVVLPVPPGRVRHNGCKVQCDTVPVEVVEMPVEFLLSFIGIGVTGILILKVMDQEINYGSRKRIWLFESDSSSSTT